MARKSPFSELIVVRHGELYTTSLIIADLFGRRHDKVMATIDAERNRPGLNLPDLREIEYRDTRGRTYRAYEMGESEALKIMPFIGGRKSREGQDRLVDAFLAMRAELRRQERIRAEHQANPIWQKLRADTKEAFKYVNLVLEETRKLQGKDTRSHHYINEARLCNAVLTGAYQGMDRDLLDPRQLALLDEIQRENSRMLIRGLDYPVRKQALLDRYVLRLAQFDKTGMPN